MRRAPLSSNRREVAACRPGHTTVRAAHAPRALAGKRFFEELDRDNDGRVKVDDLKICMRCAPTQHNGGARIAAERAPRLPSQAPQAA